MGNLFKGSKKAAQAAAAATTDAANKEAAAASENAAATRQAAEMTAAATRDAAAQAAEAASRQEAQIKANGDLALSASQRQEALLIEQGTAAKESAARMAQDQRDAAQGAQQGREMVIARDLAVSKAAELLQQPDKQVEVTLASDVQDQAEIDPITKRRRPTRAAFMSNPKQATSGITL